MAIVYVGIVLFILLMNFDQIIPMIGTIIKSAFGMEQVAGGAVGTAILQGINVAYSLTKQVWVQHPMRLLLLLYHIQ